jgi:hypothetical protein
LKASDIGAPIEALTRGGVPVPMVSVWSESRSQYIAFVGASAYVLTYSPAGNISGWSTWALPVTVDSAAEAGGRLFVRAGTAIYELSEDAPTEANFTWQAVVPMLAADTGRLKHWRTVEVLQSGVSRLAAVTDPADPSNTSEDIGTIDGSTTSMGPVVLNIVSSRLGLSFTGDGPVAIDGVALRYVVGGFA